MSYKKDYEKLLLKSLTEDIDSWESVGYGAADCSWVEYHSKEYGTKEENNRISFCIGNLNFGTCAYINGCIGIQFRVTPFSKLSKAIKTMKKYVKTKDKKGHEINMKNIIDSYKLQNI